MDALKRDGGGKGFFEENRGSQGGGGEAENGADAFAARLEAVAHGFVESGRARAGEREELIEGAFDEGDVGSEMLGEVHG